MKRSIIVIMLLFFAMTQLVAQLKPNSTLVVENTQIHLQSISNIDLNSSPKQSKSVMLAVVASLILPGMGELYAGSFESGKYNLIVEGGLWLTYLGFRKHSSWLRQDAQTYAKEHADADFTKKDDQYAVNIGNFNTTEEYNEAKSRNREYDLIYLTNSSPDYLWNWDSDANRLHFKDLRIRSDQIKNDAKFLIGAVVINHIISAFSAGRKAIAFNKSLSMIENVQIYAYAQNDGLGVNGIGLMFTTKF